MLNDVIIDPDHRLTEEQKLRVKRLVAENISAFATDPKNPTKTHLIEVELPLKPDAMPHRHAARVIGTSLRGGGAFLSPPTHPPLEGNSSWGGSGTPPPRR